jgi:hypothetical protein
MLASRSTTIGKSTNSSKLGSSSVAGKHKKDSFLVYCYKKFMTMCTAIWGRTRKTLWILSTGTYILMQGSFCSSSPSPLPTSANSKKKPAKSWEV